MVAQFVARLSLSAVCCFAFSAAAHASTAPLPGSSPSPTPAESPEPDASPYPEPSESPSPEPDASPYPEPSESPSPEPDASPDPEPSESPSPEPDASPDPEPSESPSPEPDASPDPECHSEPNDGTPLLFESRGYFSESIPYQWDAQEAQYSIAGTISSTEIDGEGGHSEYRITATATENWKCEDGSWEFDRITGSETTYEKIEHFREGYATQRQLTTAVTLSGNFNEEIQWDREQLDTNDPAECEKLNACGVQSQISETAIVKNIRTTHRNGAPYRKNGSWVEAHSFPLTSDEEDTLLDYSIKLQFAGPTSGPVWSQKRSSEDTWTKYSGKTEPSLLPRWRTDFETSDTTETSHFSYSEEDELIHISTVSAKTDYSRYVLELGTSEDPDEEMHDGDIEEYRAKRNQLWETDMTALEPKQVRIQLYDSSSLSRNGKKVRSEFGLFEGEDKLSTAARLTIIRDEQPIFISIGVREPGGTYRLAEVNLKDPTLLPLPSSISYAESPAGPSFNKSHPFKDADLQIVIDALQETYERESSTSEMLPPHQILPEDYPSFEDGSR